MVLIGEGEGSRSRLGWSLIFEFSRMIQSGLEMSVVQAINCLVKSSLQD